MTREFTGWHMLGLMLAMFGTIITVNLWFAYNAVATFPGVEDRNAYVASQKFEIERQAQDALGWDVTSRLEDGILSVTIKDAAGQPVQPQVDRAIFGRPTHVNDDQTPAFVWNGTAFTAPVVAGKGNYNLRLELIADDGTHFRRRFPLRAE
ncbi:FixH family protein [Yoonia litorea]|uniref:Nitrogen fixation protein FixH n=1 Tax=Yoonia litorea TaxID=1123755 RepID=A0A1I6N1V1_9RHOB|nr:FixH family protein [Yoonia litorea]SFS21929.1 Nitrogen fixation protein FixH [Yoonia litorea]